MRIDFLFKVKNFLGTTTSFERRAKILSNLSGLSYSECLNRIDINNRTPENIDWEKKIILNGYTKIFDNHEDRI